ncbi:MAG: hypothetical protein JO010_12425, partial [Alphaproteobacteria bacterium]|nr:hypothetical protein [Alphaproteobacteria bacterium]
LLDEPSLGLSPALVSDVFRLIQDLRGQGLAILLSEQNARRSLAIADRGYVIEMGRVVLEGAGAALLGDRAVEERYLGIGEGAAGDPDRKAQARHAALVAGLTRLLGA